MEENFYHYDVNPLLMVDKDIDLSFIPEVFNNFPPFFTLQAEQAVTTLSQLVSPPFRSW